MTPGQENVSCALEAYAYLTPLEGITSNLYSDLHTSGVIATHTE